MGCCGSKPKAAKYAQLGDVELELQSRINHQSQELCYAPINNGLSGFVAAFECMASPDELLGTGKFSSVYECTRKSNGKVYAVKVIAGAQLTPQQAKTVKDEGIILEMVARCPQCVTMLRMFQAPPSSRYLVLEELRGGELYDMVAINDTGVSEALAGNWMQQLLSALAYCHEKLIVHRDIKLENIMLCSGDDHSKIKLIDFGLAVVLKRKGAAEEFGQAGSPSYMAPEVVRKDAYGPGVDMWAAGVAMFAMLTSGMPFTGVSTVAALQQDETFRSIVDQPAIQCGPTAFPQYDWEVKDGFSDTGLGLMRALLAPDPGKRMSAAEALDHPWVSGADVYNVPI